MVLLIEDQRYTLIESDRNPETGMPLGMEQCKSTARIAEPEVTLDSLRTTGYTVFSDLVTGETVT